MQLQLRASVLGVMKLDVHAVCSAYLGADERCRIELKVEPPGTARSADEGDEEDDEEGEESEEGDSEEEEDDDEDDSTSSS